MTTQNQERPVVRVHVTRTLDDVLLLNRHLIGNQLAMRFMRWVSAIMVLAALSGIFLPMKEDAGVGDRLIMVLGPLPIPVLIFVLIPLLTSYSMRRRWRTAAEIREPVTYVFSDLGIEAIAQSNSGKTSWSNIATAERVGPFIVLGTVQRMYYMVPVKAFETKTDCKAFCTLVEKNVAKCHI